MMFAGAQKKHMGWTSFEEKDFALIQQAGHLGRLEAIRLYRRCGGDVTKALAIAKLRFEESRSKRRNNAKFRRS